MKKSTIKRVWPDLMARDPMHEVILTFDRCYMCENECKKPAGEYNYVNDHECPDYKWGGGKVSMLNDRHHALIFKTL